MLTPDMQLVLADFVMVVASFLRFEILLLRRMSTQRFFLCGRGCLCGLSCQEPVKLVAYPVFDLVKFQCFPEQRLICWPHVVRQTSMIHARLGFCF